MIVTMPYPSGTNRDDFYFMVDIIDPSRTDEANHRDIVLTRDGIKFELHDSEAFAISWRAVEAESQIA